MAFHKVRVIFNGVTFAKCYFSLAEEKSVLLTRGRGGAFRGCWEKIDLRDAAGEESVRFSLAARGVRGGRYSLEILVDGKKFRTYKEKDGFHYEGDGWLANGDIVSLPASEPGLTGRER
jgi:hypothetical protein